MTALGNEQIGLAAVVYAASKYEEDLDPYLNMILFSGAQKNIPHLHKMMSCKRINRLNE